jgi:hypothetical protein
MKPFQDLYVIFRPKSDPDKTYLVVFEQFERGHFREYATSDMFEREIPNNIQPFFLDIDGDMKNDIMLQSIDANGKAHIDMNIAKADDGKEFDVKSFNAEFVIPHDEDTSCLNPSDTDMISSPHSNSFIDFNGDCMPDLFLQK